MKTNLGKTKTRIKYFTIMNSPSFDGSQVEEDPHEFIHEVYEVLMIMGMARMKKGELVLINS